jgi:hypothetical protein
MELLRVTIELLAKQGMSDREIRAAADEVLEELRRRPR